MQGSENTTFLRRTFLAELSGNSSNSSNNNKHPSQRVWSPIDNELSVSEYHAIRLFTDTLFANIIIVDSSIPPSLARLHLPAFPTPPSPGPPRASAIAPSSLPICRSLLQCPPLPRPSPLTTLLNVLSPPTTRTLMNLPFRAPSSTNPPGAPYRNESSPYHVQVPPSSLSSSRAYPPPSHLASPVEARVLRSAPMTPSLSLQFAYESTHNHLPLIRTAPEMKNRTLHRPQHYLSTVVSRCPLVRPQKARLSFVEHFHKHTVPSQRLHNPLLRFSPLQTGHCANA